MTAEQTKLVTEIQAAVDMGDLINATSVAALLSVLHAETKRADNAVLNVQNVCERLRATETKVTSLGKIAETVSGLRERIADLECSGKAAYDVAVSLRTELANARRVIEQLRSECAAVKEGAKQLVHTKFELETQLREVKEEAEQALLKTGQALEAAEKLRDHYRLQSDEWRRLVAETQARVNGMVDMGVHLFELYVKGLKGGEL